MEVLWGISLLVLVTVPFGVLLVIPNVVILGVPPEVPVGVPLGDAFGVLSRLHWGVSVESLWKFKWGPLWDSIGVPCWDSLCTTHPRHSVHAHCTLCMWTVKKAACMRRVRIYIVVCMCNYAMCIWIVQFTVSCRRSLCAH